MIHGIRQSVVWLLLASVAWAAVWCCCRADARVTLLAYRSCCATPTHATTSQGCLPTVPDECPILRVRQTSIAESIVVLRAFDPFATPFAVPSDAWGATALDRGRTPAVAHAGDPPPRPPGALVELHTSLVC